MGSATKTITRMSVSVALMMQNAMRAFMARNLDLAGATCKQGRNADQMNGALIREMLTFMMESPRNIEAATLQFSEVDFLII